ncbi:MAG: HEPN domain-containing protein [Deltaproteobacteria bacterium]|nr:HEPN domain-containing protein [Deltaproteobacteria bacterium]
MPEKHQIDLAAYRIGKAKERLSSAEALLAAGSFADSIGRSYYAIFTAARVLLALKGLDSKRHSGVVALFNEHFIKSGLLAREVYQIITSAKAKRERADYEDYVEFGKEEAEEQLKEAKEFVKESENLFIKLSK